MGEIQKVPVFIHIVQIVDLSDLIAMVIRHDPRSHDRHVSFYKAGLPEGMDIFVGFRLPPLLIVFDLPGGDRDVQAVALKDVRHIPAEIVVRCL